MAKFRFAALLLPIAIGAAAADDVELRIDVRSAGKPVRDAYVGLVPPARPWSRPLVESVAPTGSVVIRVPAGTYRIVAGASDQGVAVTAAVAAAPGQKNAVEVNLPPLVSISGTVRDGRGRPVAGATVADVNALIEPPLGRLSELAARHFGSRWQTVTADDGTWSLRRPAEANNPIVIQSPGLSPEWHALTESPRTPVELTLRDGAQLRLRLDRADPAFVVTLVARGGTTSVPAAWQPQFWGRRAGQGVVAWSSLPVGSYDVIARQLDVASFPSTRTIASVALRAGETREVAATLPAAAAPPSARFAAFLDGVARTGLLSATFSGLASTGGPAIAPHAVEEVSGGTIVHLSAAAAREPFFGVTDKAFIAIHSRVAGSQAELRATVHERGSARARVRSAADDLPLPRFGTVAFSGCANSEAIPIPVSVDKDGVAAFDGPAHCKYVALMFANFGAVVLHAELLPQQQVWLGDHVLYPSGSAAVRAMRDETSPVPDAEIVIEAREADATAVVLARATTNVDGWAYFDDLPAGRELTVTARIAGGDASLPHPFRVEPHGQTTIDPLLILQHATLIVEPELAAEFMTRYPAAFVERIAIEPELAGRKAPTRTESVSRAGVAEFRDVKAGRYGVVALVRSGKRLHPVRGDRVLEIEPGAEAKVSMTFTPLAFRGRVVANGKNLEGNIDIRGPRRSDLLPSVPLTAEGEFEAMLPRRDVYLVTVRPSSDPGMIWVGEVAFRDPARVVEIPLPAGSIAATVRTDAGPAADLPVMLRAHRDASEGVQVMQTAGITDAHGETRVDGLVPGVWHLSVTDPRTRKQVEKVITVRGDETVRVELLLEQDLLTVSGTVREAFGAPVAGSDVTCIVPAADGIASAATTTSASDGAFEVELPAHAHRSPIVCGVRASGRVQGYRLLPGEPAELLLPAKTAALTVEGLARLHRLTTVWLVSPDGRIAEVTPFIKEGPDSAMLSIPALAPGRWRVVKVSSIADWIALVRGAPSSPLIEVTLTPGENKTVDLKKEK